MTPTIQRCAAMSHIELYELISSKSG
jgi:hypothetical protein